MLLNFPSCSQAFIIWTIEQLGLIKIIAVSLNSSVFSILSGDQCLSENQRSGAKGDSGEKSAGQFKRFYVY